MSQISGLKSLGFSLLLASGSWLLLSGCSRAPRQTFHFHQPAMYTLWDFELVGRDQNKAQQAVDAATAEINRLDDELAMWKPGSVLSAINQAAGLRPVTVPAEVLVPLQIALRIAKESGGGFDPTVGPLTTSWYYSLKKGVPLSQAQVKRLRSLVGWQKVQINAQSRPATVYLPEKGMKLDLGGLAKGYAQDLAAKILRQHGFGNFLMNAGGEVYAAGHRADGTPWRVGIEHPRDATRLVTVLPVQDGCLATSGDYEQRVVIHGVAYHHIFDPKTGFPTQHACISATSWVPMNSRPYPGAFSDAIGTAAFVLGPEKGEKLLESMGVSGVLIGEDPPGHYRTAVTKDLKNKVQLNL